MSNFVYIHLFPNGKRYVGCTRMKKVNDRWHGGANYHHQTRLYNAIKKYGWKNITHEVFECDTPEEMWYLERYLIAYYNTTHRDKGYNCSTGGEKSSYGVKIPEDKIRRGFHQTEEVKKKISKSLKGENAPWYGKHLPDDTKLKMSISRKGRQVWNKGKKMGPAWNKGIALPKQKWLTPSGEIREMNISHVKQWHPDWTRIE